ncbi:MAG: hypothetical protein QF530_02315 [SAR202 cluster bacterium]|uniref:Alkyl hydroperoxide reductase subunit C/ Thiol specific antioxidant domain-containing protein n=1 Tax=marine metagenome TaxID=408172 RepID=A0A382XCD4_9ZZZZ|nr:hypothetical protein [SAR202 cluster bacterium]
MISYRRIREEAEKEQVLKSFRNVQLFVRPGWPLIHLTISILFPAVFMLLVACSEGTSTTMPDFELPDTSGSTVSLSNTLSHSHFAVLVFYRGHF